MKFEAIETKYNIGDHLLYKNTINGIERKEELVITSIDLTCEIPDRRKIPKFHIRYNCNGVDHMGTSRGPGFSFIEGDWSEKGVERLDHDIVKCIAHYKSDEVTVELRCEANSELLIDCRERLISQLVSDGYSIQLSNNNITIHCKIDIPEYINTIFNPDMFITRVYVPIKR